MMAVLGWHFLRDTRRLGYEDNRLVRSGHTFRYKGDEPIKLCERGFHASKRAIDALNYAPGPIVCRVKLSGTVIKGEDKLVATERTVLWMANATDLLFEFSCWVAEAALIGQVTQGFAVDERSWKALQVRRLFQQGKATQDELSAAESAAWSAAWSAARSAAWSAAWSAARSAAWSAAWSAARSAAESAARSAAWSAAESAAWSAAESAARSAALDLQNSELEHRLLTLAPKRKRGR